LPRVVAARPLPPRRVIARQWEPIARPPLPRIVAALEPRVGHGILWWAHRTWLKIE
jgi:hypothetical protein